MRVSHYELYQASYGQWTLGVRFMPKDEALARARAESTWVQGRTPVILLREFTLEDSSEPEVNILYRSPGSFASIKPPDADGSISSQLTMAVLNGVIIGAVGGGVVGLATKSLGLGIFLFFALTAAACLMLFRMMVPMESMMWRNKLSNSRRKVVEAIVAAAAEDQPETSNAPSTARPESKRPWRKGAFSHASGQPPRVSVRGGSAIVSEANQPMSDADGKRRSESASDLLQKLINRQVEAMTTFTESAMGTLGRAAQTLQAFDRYGINLYVAGAAQELAWREALTAETLQSILVDLFTKQGQSADDVKVFCSRLDGALSRPRYKVMLDAGKAAMAAVISGGAIPEELALNTVLKVWSNPHDKTVAASMYAVLLTDMIGSTDATRKLGNSGAQRMLRGHNAIVRAALKECKGTEIKHTGDGILAIFDAPANAVEAGRAIQQDTLAYVQENPDLPLSLRIGVEYGEGAQDAGEYYGPVFSAIEATCDAAGGGDIAVTPLVKDKSSSSSIKYVPLTPSPTTKAFVEGMFKLVWEPKRVYNAPPLEYRQLGAHGGKLGAPSDQ